MVKNVNATAEQVTGSFNKLLLSFAETLFLLSPNLYAFDELRA
jgi:hypothetical protein